MFLRDNPKWLGLPSDSARVAFVYALIAAFLERVRGVWLGREYLEAALREYSVYLDDLIASDLVRVNRNGTLVIPQWRMWNPMAPAEERKQDELLRQLVSERRRAKDRERKRLAPPGATPESPGISAEITHEPGHIESEREGEQQSERESEIVSFASRTSDSSTREETVAPAAVAAPLPPTCSNCGEPIIGERAADLGVAFSTSRRVPRLRISRSDE